MQQEKTDFQLLKDLVDSGREGKNKGVPIGFPRLNNFIGIRKRIYTLIFGGPGTGKSSLAQEMFLLNPVDYMISQGKKEGIKFKMLLFSMERSKMYYQAKWISRKIFLNHGIYIPIKKLLGWKHDDVYKLSLDEYDLFLMYEEYIDMLMEEYVEIHEGPQNPTGIYKAVKRYADNNGKTEEISEFKKVYIPNHSNEIVIPMVDHHGITKVEKPFTNKKEAVDKLSEYMQIFRDQYGYSPVDIGQINRELGHGIYGKSNNGTDYEPTLDHVKESGRFVDDADQVVAIFEPIRYKVMNHRGYDVEKFVDQGTGAKYYRSLIVLKNNFDSDGVAVATGFHGGIGHFKELPRKQDIEEELYTSIKSQSYFLQ